MKELTTEIKQYELSENKSSQLEAVFIPMLDMLKPMEEDYNSIIADAENGIDEDITARAKRLRLDIGKVRIETEKKRKAEKNESLRLGKAIDGIANVVKYAVSSKEEKLKDIETHLERIEADRLDKLGEERAVEVLKYVDDDAMLSNELLAEMDLDVFYAYLSAKKTALETAQAEENARIEAKAKAEREREAEEARIREENAKLKAEAEIAEKERLAKEEEEAKVRAETEAKEKAIQEEKAEAERKAGREKLAKEKAVREAKEAEERAEKAEKAKIEAEEKAERDAIEAEERRVREAKEAEERRLSEIKALSESSTEITPEQILRAKAEGKAVFVTVVRIETDCEESGIFIAK
jgi:hypothetical protein